MAEHHTFDCSGCGAELEYAPGTESMTCDFCRAVTEIRQDNEDWRAPEYDFREALARLAEAPQVDLAKDGVELQCNNCGARTVCKEQSTRCPYCDSPVVVVDEKSENSLAPESLLPFAITVEQATARFRKWVKGLWFTPWGFKKRAEQGEITGVYLPYWTYDSHTTSAYSGQRGEDYWTTEWYTDHEGKRRSRQVKKTRWYPASGVVDVFFNDVLICASRSLPTKLIHQLEPWDLENLTPFQPAFLAGLTAERYAVALEPGFGRAKKRMESGIRAAVRRDIGGDHQRISSVQSEYDKVKFKHILLPLWISSYRFGDKVFRFTVNPRTGEVAGERPWSVTKIILFILGILAVVGGGAAFVGLISQ